MKDLIRTAFTFKGIYSLKKARLSRMILLFVVLVLLIAFPLNYQLVRNSGFKNLNVFSEELRNRNPAWLPDELPDIIVTRSGLDLRYLADPTEMFSYKTDTGTGETYEVIFNPQLEIFSATDTIVFEKTCIIFFDQNGEKLETGYRNLRHPVNFIDLRIQEDKSDARMQFFDMIDSIFGEYMALFSIMVNTGVQYLMNILFVLVLASILLLVRINYKQVTTFKENISIVIGSMVIPALIMFAIGLSGLIEVSTFTVVIFQLLVPLIALGAIYRGGTEKEISTRYFK